MSIYILIILLFFAGCSSEHFIIYSMNGEKYDKKSSSHFNAGSSYNFKLFFDRNEIEIEYDEVAIFSTDNFYYGQFFFDDVFMKILKTKVNEINADALIYEKNRKDFPDYNKKFLYFTVIRYKFNSSKLNEN